MDVNSGPYKFVLLLHILSVVVGIGAVMLNGVYAVKAKAAGMPATKSIMQANFDVSNVAEKVIYTIPIWGIALVAMSDSVFEFGQTWVWLSLLLYIAAIGISHAVMIPSSRAMLAGPSGPEQAAELEKKLATGGMTLNLIVVVILALMIWKPGF
jgi:hypothetical protein